MFRKALAITIVAAVVGLVGVLGVSLVAAQQAASASRSFDSASVAPGDEVVVTITAADYGSLGAVTETLPAGFSYLSSSLTDEGEVTEIDARTVRFTLQGADKTFTYTVTASNTAGRHTFSGMLRDSDRVDSVVGGATSVTVEAPAEGPSASASRSFDSASVAPGDEVVVTITTADYGSLGAVTETLPAGFSYVSSSLTDEGEVTEIDALTVRFTLQGADKTFNYTVTTSNTAGRHTFSGMLRDSDRVDSVVGGATSVTVEAPAEGPSASATRSFDSASVAPGDEVVVTITAADYGSLGAVTETLPGGFSYVSSSLTDEGEVTEIDARTVRFTLQGADKTFTYTVTASNTVGPHTFSGMLRDSDRVDSVVGGATSVRVEAPAEGPSASATRSFDSASVAPGDEVVVTITAADYGSLGAVTETLPAGFSYVSSSLTDEGEVTEIDARTVRFTLQGADKTFTYTVTASNTAGRHTFSGMLRDSDRVDSVVGGATSVTVQRPTPAPTPSRNAGPVFRSAAVVSVEENTTEVATVRATDRDRQDTVTSYAISGGADSDKFSIVAATGELSFTTAPDFENPADAGANNEYVVRVRASSGAGSRARTANQTILVTVTDVTTGNVAGDAYDANENGVIEGPEVIQAVKDYFNDSISGPEVTAVVELYFAGRSS